MALRLVSLKPHGRTPSSIHLACSATPSNTDLTMSLPRWSRLRLIKPPRTVVSGSASARRTSRGEEQTAASWLSRRGDFVQEVHYLEIGAHFDVAGDQVLR